MKNLLRRLQTRKGQTLMEYALILAFVSVVVISVMITLGQNIKGLFPKIASARAAAQSSH